MDGTDGLCGQAAPKRWEGLHSELSYKRLENGAFKWPPVADGVMRMNAAQLAALLSGMDWTRMHAPRIAQPKEVA